MNLGDIVCDFEYAEKLSELGLNRESVFFYWGNKIKLCGMFDYNKYNPSLRTYTVAELGEMLPKSIGYVRDCEMFLSFYKNGDEYEYDYNCRSSSLCSDKKEANSRAKLLIWLIENKHVKVEELNG